jgi:hypothetical protein
MVMTDESPPLQHLAERLAREIVGIGQYRFKPRFILRP